MHRQPDHVMAFFLAEREQVDHLMDSKDEYVICLSCKSPDIILLKENHLFYLQFEKIKQYWFRLIDHHFNLGSQ
ncbi:hypothetical protein RCOM_1165360 [Ricinus communis]|uniref:Uncharacterized protein n=1 Tax=Ricinus communis TaxID=3988 RepID=B9SD93_RICCO|nr:hypothetical protein RCOM_1165360 [Ricinus communis]